MKILLLIALIGMTNSFFFHKILGPIFRPQHPAPAPPVYHPPVVQPPVYQPPVYQPPVVQPPPPVFQPAFFAPGVRYTIRSKNSNLFVRADNACVQGSKIRQFFGNRNDVAFLWTFERTNENCNEYFIRSAVHPNYVIDIEHNSQHDGADAIVWPKHGGHNQIFRAEKQHDGSFIFFARHSNKVLDIEGISFSQGAKLYQWNLTGANNQRFFIESC